MARVVLEQVSKVYPGGVRAVDAMNLTVADQEFVVLVGPSGCGKTTTLRMVAGLEEITAGRISIGERVVNDVPPKDRDIAMVFQNYALYPHMTVFENIAFPLRMRRMREATIGEEVSAMARLLGLDRLVERKPAQLSGGQRQRVALGRAIVSEAPVCLMDEPLSNLDAKLRHEMRREIRTLQQRLGITMIYVTHDQVEAMTMADKIVLLNEGRVEQFAPPDEIYARPATLFAAGFIGTPPMNLLPFKEENVAAWARAHLAGVLPESDPEGLILGVRPEKISLAESGLPVEVIGLEYLGADSLIACRLGGRELVARESGRIRLTAEDRVNITWPPSETHLFDAGTGKRLD